MLAPPPTLYRRDKGGLAYMVDAGLAGRERRSVLPAIVVALTILFVAEGIAFATVQNVWIDESTQLLGSTLPFGRMIAWLAGHPEPLGVPADRMPPLGYLVDWIWTRIGGTEPFGFRIVHLAFAAAAVAGLIALAGRRYGAVAALVTGALLIANPGVITVAVEARAYPLFLAATVLQLWLFDGMFRDGVGTGRLIAFTGAGLAAVFVHFFGLVSSSALFVGLFAARARSRSDLLRIGASWLALLLLSAGIAPFVGGARAISSDAAPQAEGMAAMAAYLPRIYGHAAMLLHPFLAVIVFLALGALLLVTAWHALAALPPLRKPASMEAALIVALVAGLMVTIGAGLVVRGFDPMKPSYSIWMVPIVTLLAGAACAPGGRISRAATGIAIVAVAALLPITIAFARHAPWFVHGPERAIAAEIRSRAQGTAIVYVGHDWGYGYFPLIQRYGRALPQYLLDAGGNLHPLANANPDNAPVPLGQLAGVRQVLLVSIEPRTGGDLRALAEGTADPALFTPLAASLDGWHRTNSIVRPGLYWLRLVRLERNEA